MLQVGCNHGITSRGNRKRSTANIKTWRGLKFPLPLSKIGVFEQNNNVSVNVLAIGKGKEKLYILRKAKFDNQRRNANLLLKVEDEERHYVTIKNLSRLFVSSNSNDGHQQHFCLNCLQGLVQEQAFRILCGP